MAKKGKVKISKLKRNNHTTNKMRKQGTLRLQRHRQKVQKQQPQPTKQIEYSSEEESASGDDWADMLDDDEQKYIMTRLAKDPSLLSSVPQKDIQEDKSSNKRKRGRDKKPKDDITPDSGTVTDSEESESEASEVEEKYEKEQSERPAKRMRSLLPIKTKQGVVERTEEFDEPDSDEEPNDKEQEEDFDSNASEAGSDSGMEVDNDAETADGAEDNEVVSTVQLLAARRDTLNKEKIRIGALCSSLVECPEKKLKNLYPILYLMEEHLKDGTANLHSVRKLATMSAFEVFKDILPDYLIRHQDYSNIKLKKDTLALYKYEKELLEFYKRYLQRLEKATAVLRPKTGDTRKPDEATQSLALVSLRCMCGLLSARPHFNYGSNIAQSVIPLLAARGQHCRDIVTQCCETVFSEDNKGDITLTIVRLINQLVKKRGSRMPADGLKALLSLRLRGIELDAENDVKIKQKKDEKHKKRIVNLSKKEKKRNKKLREVERELLETEAKESDIAHKKQMTEVTKTVFHIYFRVLKTAPRSALLAAVLDGLHKFTHVINLEYYTELVSILAQLLKDSEISLQDRVSCARTALGVLAGSGDSLNVDPARFHAFIYHAMLGVHAASPSELPRTIINSVQHISSRVRRVSPPVLQALAKRLLALAVGGTHCSALAALAQIYSMSQQSKPVQTLLTSSTEESIGSGKYDPFSPSPEHCNAQSAPVWELSTLSRHYHPTVRQTAVGLTANPPYLPQELAKKTPNQICKEYDGSKMAFKPPIPPPKKQQTKSKMSSTHVWTQTSLFNEINQIVKI